MVPGTPAGTSNYDTSKPCHQFFGVGPWAAHPNNVRDFWDNGLVTNVNVAVGRSSERPTPARQVGAGVRAARGHPRLAGAAHRQTHLGGPAPARPRHVHGRDPPAGPERA